MEFTDDLVLRLKQNPITTAVVFLSILTFVPKLWGYFSSYWALSHIPTIGFEKRSFFDFGAHWRARMKFVWECKSLGVEGYKKFPTGSVWKVWTPDGYKVACSPDLAGDITAAPDTVLSSNAALQARFLGWYTGMDSDGDLRNKCVRVDLTKKHAKQIAPLVEENKYAIPKHIGECDEWTAYPLQPTLLKVIALLSGRIMIGSPRNRNEEWCNTVIQYSMDAFGGGAKLRLLPTFLRPIGAALLPDIRRVKNHQDVARRTVIPIVLARRSGEEKPQDDFLQWMMDSANENEQSPEFLAKQFLIISLASIHTTTMSLSKAIFDLLSHPEYIEPMRQEIERVYKEEGGVFTNAMSKKLELMDSFFKESQRRSPPQPIGTPRIAVHPDGFTFSTGHHVPQGTEIIGCPWLAASFDPAILEKPDEFDGYRFIKMRAQSAEADGRYTYAATSLGHWGYGKHVCPGRFFADTEMKIVLCDILMKYDIRFAGSRKERPNDLVFELNIAADNDCQVEFRRRRL